MKPTAQQLKAILARHRGWLANQQGGEPLPEHDRYLEEVEPAYPNWLDEARSHPEQANLRDANLVGAKLIGAKLIDADLSDANLRDANLSDAVLSGAVLIGANLSDMVLIGAVLRGANLSSADLSSATLFRANLSDAALIGAKLEHANLRYANLAGADLRYANLRDAHLLGAVLSEIKLAYADLTNATYAPASAPPDAHVAGIRGLSTVRIPPGEEVGLVQLRKLLQDAGIRDLEREATYSIERSRTTKRFAFAPGWLRSAVGGLGSIDKNLAEGAEEQIRARQAAEAAKRRGDPMSALGNKRSEKFAWSERFAWIGGVFRVIAFDWTTKYGRSPGRALVFILGLWFLFTWAYFLSIYVPPTQRSQATPLLPHPLLAPVGIYHVFPKDRINETAPDPTNATLAREGRAVRVHDADWKGAIADAAYFSLLSAVNIGFQQFTPGDWLSRLQASNYSLEAVGWVRTVAGIQALLSVFLLAMWVLTQFGRPFQ